MTIDEAIETVEYARAFNKENTALMRALDVLIGFAEYFQEAEKNEPLTMDDLKEMDGQPVWAEEPDGYKHYSRWCLVDCAWKSKGLIYLRAPHGQITIEAFIADGGKIYRHPPKEVQK